jgi:hypothetical protein
MINQQGGKWVAKCDRCGTTINTGQKSFHQAANYLNRAEGWDSWEHGGQWTNYCPRCVEGGDLIPTALELGSLRNGQQMTIDREQISN